MANDVVILKDVVLKFTSMEKWQTRFHVMANGEHCPAPNWRLFAGIGSSCRYCGRIEYDGKCFGYVAVSR